jgi:hypothetical protein
MVSVRGSRFLVPDQMTIVTHRRTRLGARFKVTG